MSSSARFSGANASSRAKSPTDISARKQMEGDLRIAKGKAEEIGRVEFACLAAGPILTFYVKDSGIGISELDKELIFDRFRQVDDSLIRTQQGAWLGLAATKAYVSILGGQLWFDSAVGAGSTFDFALPAGGSPRA